MKIQHAKDDTGHDHHGHSHDESHNDATDSSDVQHDHSHSSHTEMSRTSHDGHAHSRVKAKKGSRLHDINILGVLIHIIGDALNSVAVSKLLQIISDSSFNPSFSISPNLSGHEV